MIRFAKIVATLGPSSSDEPRLREMIEAGMDVARLNFSHGTHEDHATRIQMLRRLSLEMNKPVAILMDLQGPKLRIGNLAVEPLTLTAGQTVALRSAENTENLRAGVTFIPFDVPQLHKALIVGNHILLDDGNLEFQVTELDGENIYATVLLGGDLKSHKGVNLPGSNLDIPILTEKDLKDLAFGLEQGVDLIAVSFVKVASDIEMVRQRIIELAGNRNHPPIIAKLERPEALDNLDAIMQATDGVMVARGDLGVEMSPATVPSAQKSIINAANRSGKFVITATQMLESMINNPRPTRAEAADIANAIYDGTDAVMLSAETAAGKYPVQSIRMMNSIILEAEKHKFDWGHAVTPDTSNCDDDSLAITSAARDLAEDINVEAVVVFTLRGKTALLMSKTKPRVPIYAFTPEISTYHWLGILWGVT
ncbi:MAG: pyruvate kinase, partial [Anaerolineaceae bacterium]